jgi:hypothetical protein
VLWKYAFEPFLLRGYRGRPYLPVLRLHAPTLEAGIWFYWRICVNYGAISSVAFDTGAGTLPVKHHHCPGSVIFLPPWPVSETDLPPGISLELCVQASYSGAHALDLDCLNLLPYDFWRIYRPALGGYNRLHVTDDPYYGTLKAGYTAIQMHQPEGRGLMVLPGRDNLFAFLMERAGGGFSIEDRAKVRIGYRPRWREL